MCLPLFLLDHQVYSCIAAQLTFALIWDLSCQDKNVIKISKSQKVLYKKKEKSALTENKNAISVKGVW